MLRPPRSGASCDRGSFRRLAWAELLLSHASLLCFFISYCAQATGAHSVQRDGRGKASTQMDRADQRGRVPFYGHGSSGCRRRAGGSGTGRGNSNTRACAAARSLSAGAGTGASTGPRARSARLRARSSNAGGSGFSARTRRSASADSTDRADARCRVRSGSAAE